VKGEGRGKTTMGLLFVLFVGIVVVALLVILLAFYRTPLGDASRRDILRNQSKEINAQPVEGESIPRRHVLFNDLHVTKKNLFTALKETCSKHADLPCLGHRKLVKLHKEQKVINGQKKDWEFLELSPFNWLTYAQFLGEVQALATGLRSLGLKPGENFGIYEETRLEWTLTAQACFSQAIPVVTVYSNLGLDALVFALNEGELRYVLTNGKMLKTLLAEKPKLNSLEGIIYTDDADPEIVEKLAKVNVKAIPFAEVVAKGKTEPFTPETPGPDDLAVIMYTSGSTGNPKGVMISHSNILSAVEGGYRGVNVAIDSQDTYISYLPLAHILALVVETLCLSRGAAIGYGNPRSLIDSEVRGCRGDLNELRPTIMAGVPTVFDKVKKGAMDKVNRASPTAKKLFHFAFQQKKQALSQYKDTPFWNLLIFNKIKAQVGGRLRLIVSGGAPLSKETHEFLRVALTPNTVQGYGLTETCGGGTLMMFEDITSYLCVGPPLTCSELKLVDTPELNYRSSDRPNPRGEVWIRGANVTQGYYKNEEKTKEEFRPEGWFSTGDIGEWLPSGALKIIDRKKNIVKLAHGEYIALELLESIYKNSPFVENVCVTARSSENFCLALIVPSKRNLQTWAGVEHVDDAFLQRKDVRDHVQKSLEAAAKAAKLKTVDIPKYVFLCSEEWTPENGLMTAAMKIKRYELEKILKHEIDRMYSKGHQ